MDDLPDNAILLIAQHVVSLRDRCASSHALHDARTATPGLVLGMMLCDLL